jgi:hypothetical protein
MSFKKGDKVVQVMPAPVEGEVAGFSLDQDTGEVIVLVSSVDADGVEHSRYFKQSEIQAA